MYDFSSIDLVVANKGDIGLHSMRITWTVGTVSKTQTFFVQIYPSTSYTAGVTSSECHDQPITKY
jgi:hypothetical protein